MCPNFPIAHIMSDIQAYGKLFFLKDSLLRKNTFPSCFLHFFILPFKSAIILCKLW